ncbi:hypothetical protein AB0D11_39945 [Streptomyces monashensis]|uniref:hypothetical protein n=1 Tax=Streptomyces monashensis TaxID=1678012 RepID=UPI00340DCAF1
MSKNAASLAALCASVFVVGTSEYLVAAMLPEVGVDLQVPQSTAGQAVTAWALGVVIGGPAVPMLTAWLPRKPLALGLMPVFAAGIVLSALAPSFRHAAFLALVLVLVLPKQQLSSAGLRDELRLVNRKPVLLAVATTAVGFAGVAVVFACSALLLTRIAGFSPAAVSALLFAYGAGSSLGDLAASELTDRSMSATVRGVFGGWTSVLVAMPNAAAVAADVGAFNLGAAADSALGGPSSPPGLCAGPAWPGPYSASAAWP